MKKSPDKENPTRNESSVGAVDKIISVNRLEIIDHTSTGQGREYVKWDDKNFKIEFSYQDNGRTLKIFLKELEESHELF